VGIQGIALMTFIGRVHVSAIRQAENWIKSSSSLGYVSVQTTERYLGCQQRFHDAVNDHIGLELEPSVL
jgi:hypothetical protein